MVDIFPASTHLWRYFSKTGEGGTRAERVTPFAVRVNVIQLQDTDPHKPPQRPWLQKFYTSCRHHLASSPWMQGGVGKKRRTSWTVAQRAERQGRGSVLTPCELGAFLANVTSVMLTEHASTDTGTEAHSLMVCEHSCPNKCTRMYSVV